MKQCECDIFSFAQTSINWQHVYLRDRFRAPLKQLMPIHYSNMSKTSFKSDQAALPGGVAQVVEGNWTGRVIEYLHDFRNMGRWCGVKLRMKNNRTLYYITAYRVCNQNSNTIGVETAYNQQRFMLSQLGFDNPDPRKHFIDDLTSAIKGWQSPMDDIIVALDANEALGASANHGLTYFMRECNLVDLFHHHHGVCPDFATYDLGSKRLDYMLGSSTLLPFIVRCGYLDFYKGIPSADHRGLFLDLSNELIDGITNIERSPTRYLNSAYATDVYEYKKLVKESFESHNIFQKASDLFQVAAPIIKRMILHLQPNSTIVIH
jgi:hypothetical protein